jgi:hypothetical protein
MPKALRNIDVIYGNETPSKIISEKLQMSVWGTVVPTITVPSITVPFGGQVPKVTSFTRPAYEAIKVNFNVDNEFYNYYVIYTWLALLNDPTTSNFDQNNISGIRSSETGRIPDPKNPRFLEQYSSNISLQPLNEYNQVIGEFTYNLCFPVSLDGINFSYQDAGEVVSGFTFEFSQLTFNLNS